MALNARGRERTTTNSRGGLRQYARVVQRRYAPPMEVDDLVQEAMRRLLEGARDLSKSERQERLASPALAYRVLQGIAIDALRRKSNRIEQLDSQSPDDVPREREDARRLPPDEVLGVWEIINQLDPGPRCFVCKLVLEGESICAAQAQCRWPDASPYYHWIKLQQRLRRLMNAEEGETR